VKAPDGFLESHLRSQRDAGHKLLVPYITGGIDPRWIDLVRAAADAGADAVEIGIPFSDPVMDGPTIQAASQRALDNGATPASILDDVSAADVGIPLAVMTYFNVVFHMGVERFATEAREAGISGMILPDVPLEEMDEWAPAGRAAGLETVMLVSPLTPASRLPSLVSVAQGFVYGVNLLGVTGERAEIGSHAVALGGRIKAATDVPAVMGFGVSTPSQAADVAAHADGVVVGSALMRRVLDGEGPLRVGQAVAELRAGLDAPR
jgi:tryptophan synthase alpha chain